MSLKKGQRQLFSLAQSLVMDNDITSPLGENPAPITHVTGNEDSAGIIKLLITCPGDDLKVSRLL